MRIVSCRWVNLTVSVIGMDYCDSRILNFLASGCEKCKRKKTCKDVSCKFHKVLSIVYDTQMYGLFFTFPNILLIFLFLFSLFDDRGFHFPPVRVVSADLQNHFQPTRIVSAGCRFHFPELGVLIDNRRREFSKLRVTLSLRFLEHAVLSTPIECRA